MAFMHSSSVTAVSFICLRCLCPRGENCMREARLETTYNDRIEKIFKNHFGIFLIIAWPDSEMLPWEHFAKETLKEAVEQKARI